MIAKIKKIIPYLLLLIALAGVFGYGKNIEAQTPGVKQCYTSSGVAIPKTAVGSESLCLKEPGREWRDNSIPAVVESGIIACRQNQFVAECTLKLMPLCGTIIPCKNKINAELTKIRDSNIENKLKELGTSTTGNSPFEDAISKQTCVDWGEFSMTACILNFTYVVFYQLGGWLLGIAAVLFNFLISYTLDSSFLRSDFISHAWGVVRDISNMFFILILLYIGIKVLLNMGGHETKSMISSVIIMAILINFSMFFTQIVIDSSNIVALIFYNKTSSIDKDGKAVIDSISGKPDLAGGLTQSFNPAYKLGADFFRAGVTDSMLIGITLISGGIMLFAAYALFVSGFSFLGRLIELFVLIIFAPFAFMSYVIPSLSHAKYVGWGSWSERLISVAFMAPIFMFFLYFIFLLLGKSMFTNAITTEGTLATLLNLIIPAAVVLTLLLKATEFAKKGSGQFGEMVMSAAKVTGALAVGGTALGVAGVGRATVGSFLKGASTGDTAANRMVGAGARIAAQKAIISDPASTVVDRTEAKKAIWRDRKDQIKGNVERFVGIQGLRNRIGPLINQDQHNIEHASHARHELDEAAGKVAHGKKWNELNGEQRYQVRRQISRDRVVRDNSGPNAALAGAPSHVPGLLAGFGTRKWDALTTAERELVDRADAVGHDPATGHVIHGGALDQQRSVADNLINDAKSKQGIVSTVVQSSVNGTYDLRNIANIVAKEQSTGFAKLAAVLGGGLAMGMRGGFKQMGANFGKPEGKFLKDLSSTIADALKNAKINVDLSHVGEEQKEGHKGGGGHH